MWNKWTFFCGAVAEPTADTVARGDIADFGPGGVVVRFGDSWINTIDKLAENVTDNTATIVTVFEISTTNQAHKLSTNSTKTIKLQQTDPYNVQVS